MEYNECSYWGVKDEMRVIRGLQGGTMGRRDVTRLQKLEGYLKGCLKRNEWGRMRHDEIEILAMLKLEIEMEKER